MAVRASDGGKGCLTVPVWRGVRLDLGDAERKASGWRWCLGFAKKRMGGLVYWCGGW